MPLVQHSDLPAFERLRAEGIEVVSAGEAERSGLPELHIAVLNLMPDTALRATDRQFARLVASFADNADLWFHVFSMGVEARGAAAREHISAHYETLDSIRERPVDALIVTGANPSYVDMTREAFWPGLFEVFSWADRAIHSKLCSCFATHAIFKLYWGVERIRLPQKMWGVYQHQITGAHDLLAGLREPVAAPHSHYYDLSRDEMESVGATVLMESEEAGVHMAVHDGFEFVFFQGHPEYDDISILKEYKREVWRFVTRRRSTYPHTPEHYFTDAALEVLEEYRSRVLYRDETDPIPGFPEDELGEGLTNPWKAPGMAIYRNWLQGVLDQKTGRSPL
jgi:homoserine O-succinyltransferase